MCHVVEPEEEAPRTLDIAPAFRANANTPGMTATALRGFLTSSHPKMPNLLLKPGKTADVIADIDSPRGGIIRVLPHSLISLSQSLKV